jgi:transposase
MCLEYLPPYSPDYDLIEEGFSAFKVWVRRHRDYTDGALAGGPNADSAYTMIWRGVHESMTAEKAVGWFAHSGYV